MAVRECCQVVGLARETAFHIISEAFGTHTSKKLIDMHVSTK